MLFRRVLPHTHNEKHTNKQKKEKKENSAVREIAGTTSIINCGFSNAKSLLVLLVLRLVVVVLVFFGFVL